MSLGDGVAALAALASITEVAVLAAVVCGTVIAVAAWASRHRAESRARLALAVVTEAEVPPEPTEDDETAAIIEETADRIRTVLAEGHTPRGSVPGSSIPIPPDVARAAFREALADSRVGSSEADKIRRVVLIERSGGGQVGERNDQLSVYRVSLPSTTFKSGQALAVQLLDEDNPWSREIFTSDPQTSTGDLGGWSSKFSVRASALGGDTLVIVRNPQGIQVGRHNIQRNHFRIRVTDAKVPARQAGMWSAETEAIARLQTNPSDYEAARSMAGEVARAARSDLVADLTVRVTQEADKTTGGYRPGIMSDRTGVQIGESSRAQVTVQVNIQKFDAGALEAALLRAPRRIARPELREEGDPEPGDRDIGTRGR